MYRRRSTYFYARKDGRWISLGKDRTLALTNYTQMTGWVAPIPVPPRFIQAIYAKAGYNARARGIQFNLTIEDAMGLWDACGGRCEVTGNRLHLGRLPRWHRRPLAPSIDRIDSASGYSRSNCRIVCVAVNAAFGEWGEDVFSSLARGYIAKKAGVLLDCPINARPLPSPDPQITA